MARHRTLVRLFWQHLIRRKSLWVVIAILGGVTLVNALVQAQMRSMIEDGVRYDIATRRAASALEGYASQIRDGAALLVVFVAALIAPAARKEGTTQFVLTLAVSRFRVAAGQYGALALFVVISAIVIHGGYCVAALRLGVLDPRDAALGAFALAGPLLLLATASFSLSLTRPAPVVYAVLLAVPFLVLPLLAMWVAEWSEDIPLASRLLAARALDNVALLFPDTGGLIAWPKTSYGPSGAPPSAVWGWEWARQIAALALWTVTGLWAYRRHDFGSRIPTR